MLLLQTALKSTHRSPCVNLFLNDQSIKMSKIERLNARVEKLLSKAVLEVLEAVKETVLEYQEKTTRTQRENQSLKRRLQELQEKLQLGSNGKAKQNLYPEILRLFGKMLIFLLFLVPCHLLLSCRNCATHFLCSPAGWCRAESHGSETERAGRWGWTHPLW